MMNTMNAVTARNGGARSRRKPSATKGIAMTMKSSPGRVAVVTGSAGVLGTAIARRLAQDGAAIVLLDLSDDLLRRAQETLSDTGAEILCVAGDLSQETSVATAVAEVNRRFGRCDILVNNVGVLPKATSFEHLPTDVWDRAFAVNLRSAFLCTRGFGALMLAQENGAIVNIGSTAASLPNSSAAYAISKAALLALSRQVAVEWGPRGVRSNAVSPGFIRTPLSEHFYADEATRTLREMMVASRRIGTLEEIANVVAFIASDAASYVNGQELIVDGGSLQTSLMLVQPERAAYAARRSWP